MHLLLLFPPLSPLLHAGKRFSVPYDAKENRITTSEGAVGLSNIEGTSRGATAADIVNYFPPPPPTSSLSL